MIKYSINCTDFYHIKKMNINDELIVNKKFEVLR